MEKRGEVKAFTDQVRVICVKNDINKPTLGQKIGMDNTMVFNMIKNNSLKIDPETYFRLESFICGKDEHYKGKLRSKYEKTLSLEELSAYVRIQRKSERHNGEDHPDTEYTSPSPDNSENCILSLVANYDCKENDGAPSGNIETEVKLKTTDKDKKTGKKTSKVDKKARTRFYELLKENLPDGLLISHLDKIIGGGCVRNLLFGNSYVPVSKMPLLFESMKIEAGTEIWSKFLDLELSCIAGKNEESELEDYERIFGKSSLKKTERGETKAGIESMHRSEDSSENTEKTKESGQVSGTTPDADKKKSMKQEFCNILTRWLFMNGYTLTRAADRIGCSEEEFKQVVSGIICLSPYHVNRFRETLDMDADTVKRLVEIAGCCYEGKEIPQTLIDYISSDSLIIDTLEEICRLKKPASFWKRIKEGL